MIARARTAKTSQKVNDMLSSMTGTTSMDAFERMKEKVEMLESKAEVRAAAAHACVSGSFATYAGSIGGWHGQCVVGVWWATKAHVLWAHRWSRSRDSWRALTSPRWRGSSSCWRRAARWMTRCVGHLSPCDASVYVNPTRLTPLRKRAWKWFPMRDACALVDLQLNKMKGLLGKGKVGMLPGTSSAAEQDYELERLREEMRRQQ